MYNLWFNLNSFKFYLILNSYQGFLLQVHHRLQRVKIYKKKYTPKNTLSMVKKYTLNGKRNTNHNLSEKNKGGTERKK